MAFNAENIAMLIQLLPEQVPYNPEKEKLMNNVGKLNKEPAMILVGVFTAVALLSVSSRIYIQLARRGRLFADDYLIIAASCSLIIETALWYHMSRLLWMTMFLMENPTQNFVYFSRGEIMDLFKFLDLNNVYLIFAWLTNYSVKLSFLVFFRSLVQGVSGRLNVYWWVVLVITVCSWLFNAIETLAVCGVGDSLKCFPYPIHNLEIGGASTGADILTDLLIVSIPILLLRKSQLLLGQKVRILVFLCLSIFMIAFALARLIGSLYHDGSGVLTLAVTWTHTWLHFESSVAVLMGGLTAFRIVFASHVREAGKRKMMNTTSFYQRFKGFWIKTSKDSNTLRNSEEKQNGFLAGPATGGTLKGLRTFIRKNGRGTGDTTIDADESMLNSKYDPLESYHHYVKGAQSETSSRPTTEPRASPEMQNIELLSRPLPVLNTHNMV